MTAANGRRRFGFYRRLTRAQKREYDRSDAVAEIRLAPDRRLGKATNDVISALATGRPTVVRAAAQELVDRICGTIRGRTREGPPRVRVLRRRPRRSGGEFHGLYTRDGDGRAEIRVWMFTAAHQDVVRPRTFLRTLLHEVVHHLDFTLYDLPSSFHTLGFHKRESSLVRVLERSGARIPGSRARSPERREQTTETVAPASIRPVTKPARDCQQLRLF